MTSSQSALSHRLVLANLLWLAMTLGLGGMETASAKDAGGDANPRNSAPRRGLLVPDEDDLPNKRKEQVELPPFPSESDLRAVDAAGTGSRYRFLLDVSSLSLGPDRAVRYTIVVQSPSGAANVFYEGIRCWSREFRTFGYGTPQGAMRPVSRSAWKDLRLQGRSGTSSYRRVLADRYVCDPDGGPSDLRDLKRRLQGKSGKRRRREDQ